MAEAATAPRLEVRSLAVSRGPARLFKDLSFTLSPGELLALRGPNGSGKTTLLRCVAGLTRADAGDVIWDGVAGRESALNEHMLYAGHAPGIKDDLNAEENLVLALRLRGREPAPEAIHEAIAAVGLEKPRLLPARRLSAGQRRRIGLARLALDGAPLWVLDEPLTALDREGEELLAARLAAHLASGGLALVATHHDLRGAGAGLRELHLQ
jgi:heme exporter protein A